MYGWKVYIRVGYFENSERRKQTDNKTEKKEKKGGEETSENGEVEGKGQALL